MKYKIVFKEGDLTVFDTIEISTSQAEKLKELNNKKLTEIELDIDVDYCKNVNS